MAPWLDHKYKVIWSTFETEEETTSKDFSHFSSVACECNDVKKQNGVTGRTGCIMGSDIFQRVAASHISHVQPEKRLIKHTQNHAPFCRTVILRFKTASFTFLSISNFSSVLESNIMNVHNNISNLSKGLRYLYKIKNKKIDHFLA